MKRYLLCCLFLGLSLSCKEETPSKITVVDKTFLQEEVVGKEVQLVDVRTQKEYESGHIDGAVNFNIIDKKTFLEQIETLDKEEAVYLYCRKGVRSNRAAKLMKGKGFTQIFDYSGGYNDWMEVNAGVPPDQISKK